MEVLAAVVSSLLAEPCRRLLIYAQSKMKNYLYFKSCFDDLDLEMKDLIERRDTVKQDVEAAEKMGLVPRPHVHDWLKEVNKIEAEVTALKEGIREGSCDCTHFRFLNSKYRENIRQSVRRQLVATKGLIEAGNFPDGVAAPVRAEHIPGPSIEYQSTAARNISQVMDLLGNDEVKSIGIWGMGGAGKTTLVTNVNNKLKSAALLKQPFSIVLWVTVSNKSEETSDLKKVQKQIANRLKMTLHNEECMERIAIQLHERLQKEKFLLILDDVWQPINLDTVGVPRSEISRGSKILLSTRFSEVCRAMMIDRILKIEVLNEQEAWLLFRESAGEVMTSEHIEPLAKEITRECCGLPLAICVVGASMRGKNMVELWEDAVNTLRRSETLNRGIESKVFSPLKLSYDSLPDKRIKSCFLYCCLYPEDHLIDIDELIWYWLAEGLLDDRLNLKQVRNRGITVIECLKDHCLLEKGHKKGTVKMHDIVRDVAIWIASSLEEEGKTVIKPALGLRRITKESIFESAKRLSFMCNSIYMLPESVSTCPLASTLLLQGNDSLEHIPDKFLQAFLSLRVLNLSGCSIKSLPLSLDQLVELRALILAKCKNLEEIPSVGELCKLQLLNCSCTNIKALPEGMERLTNLRQLDLSEIRSSTTIRAGSIAALSSLESLSMNRSTGKWLTHGYEGELPCLLEEIFSLDRLSFCHIVLASIPRNVSPGDPLFLHIKKLERFTVFIGSIHFHSALFGDESRRRVILSGLHFSEEWTGWLFSNATSVQLVRCEGLNQMFEKIAMHGSCVGSFEGLCKLDIARSNSSFELTAIWDMKFDLLPNLETLCLSDLSRITCISRLAEHLGLKFHKLRHIRIERCPKLKYLLSLGVSIPKLGQLKEITVDSCEELVELFCYDFTKPNQTFAPDAAFPNIQKTTLRSLPKLLHFSRLSMVPWPSMEKLEVINCNHLRMVFGPIQNANSTKEV